MKHRLDPQPALMLPARAFLAALLASLIVSCDDPVDPATVADLAGPVLERQ